MGAEGDGGEGASVHLELEVAAVVGADLTDPIDRLRPLPERPHDAVRPGKRKMGLISSTFYLATSKTNSLINLDKFNT